MFYGYREEGLRLIGRWDRSMETHATSICVGSYIEAAFFGNEAILKFDLDGNIQPHPHLWIQIGAGVMVESTIAEYIRIRLCRGEHTLRVVFKSANEDQQRWFSPVAAKVCFCGIEVERLLPLKPDNRPILEVLGDSITEGILIEPYRMSRLNDDPREKIHRVLQDDVCLDYAWLAAEALNMRPRVIGFGALGVTKGGSGNIPCAAEMYPWVIDGVPLREESASIVAIMLGTNDYLAEPEAFSEGYGKLLRVVRMQNPNALIACLRPFNGTFTTILSEFVEKYNRETQDEIRFIDTVG